MAPGRWPAANSPGSLTSRKIAFSFLSMAAFTSAAETTLMDPLALATISLTIGGGPAGACCWASVKLTIERTNRTDTKAYHTLFFILPSPFPFLFGPNYGLYTHGLFQLLQIKRFFQVSLDPRFHSLLLQQFILTGSHQDGDDSWFLFDSEFSTSPNRSRQAGVRRTGPCRKVPIARGIALPFANEPEPPQNSYHAA